MFLTNCPSLKRLLSGEQNKGKSMSWHLRKLSERSKCTTTILWEKGPYFPSVPTTCTRNSVCHSHIHHGMWWNVGDTTTFISWNLKPLSILSSILFVVKLFFFSQSRVQNCKQWQILFSWAPTSLQMVTVAMKLKEFAPWKKSYDKPVCLY